MAASSLISFSFVSSPSFVPNQMKVSRFLSPVYPKLVFPVSKPLSLTTSFSQHVLASSNGGEIEEDNGSLKSLVFTKIYNIQTIKGLAAGLNKALRFANSVDLTVVGGNIGLASDIDKFDLAELIDTLLKFDCRDTKPKPYKIVATQAVGLEWVLKCKKLWFEGGLMLVSVACPISNEEVLKSFEHLKANMVKNLVWVVIRKFEGERFVELSSSIGKAVAEEENVRIVGSVNLSGVATFLAMFSQNVKEMGKKMGAKLNVDGIISVYGDQSLNLTVVVVPELLLFQELIFTLEENNSF